MQKFRYVPYAIWACLILLCFKSPVARAEITVPSSTTQTNRPLVVCLGDSITHRGYPQVLGKLLDVRVVNAGINGNTSRQGLARLQRDVLSLRPDAVVVFFGANDSRLDSPKTQVDLPEYKSNLEKIIDRCQKAGAKVLLGTMPPIVSEPYYTRHPKKDYDVVGGLQKRIEQYRETALKVGQQKNVPVVDLNELLKKEPKWVSDDGVHPTPEGNEILARLMAEKLKPLLTAPRN